MKSFNELPIGIIAMDDEYEIIHATHLIQRPRQDLNIFIAELP